MDEITKFCPLYNFPAEAAIVGRIIVAYGELEIQLLRPVALASNTDIDTAIRLLYRPHSESARIDAYDSLVRSFTTKHGLESEYEAAHAKLHTCKRLRNQYAHCQWDTNDDTLSFINLDEAAKTASGETKMEKRHVPLALLQKQEAYFGNTHHYLAWFNRELQSRTDQNVTNQISKPPTMHPPRPYNQEHPHSPRNLEKARRRGTK